MRRANLFNWIKEPGAKSIKSLDDPKSTHIHRDIILNKRVLYEFYKEKYLRFKQFLKFCPGGLVLEIGSGSGLSKTFFPEMICSEIEFFPWVDVIFDASKIPFPDNSISCIFLDGVFHHLPDTKKFLSEARRCLKVGGQIYLIEPEPTLLSRFVFKYIHHEPFDQKAGWELDSKSGENRLTKANLALPWIVFERDKLLFNELFPNFKITKSHAPMPLQYAFSGGLSYRQFWPTRLWWFIRFLEWASRPWYRFISFDMIIN